MVKRKNDTPEDLGCRNRQFDCFNGSWVEVSLINTLREKIKIGPFGSQLKKETLVTTGEYKVYGQENIYKKNFSIGDRFLSKEHFDRLSSCEIKSGDFLISTMGTIGKCAIAPLNIQKGIMDSHLIRLRLDEKKLLSAYLLQLFSDNYTYLSNQTAKLAVGGIMDGLSVGIAKQLTVLMPEDLREQDAIAHTLSQFDTYIDDLAKLIEKKRCIRDGALEDLISHRTRVDGFKGEWTKVTFNQVITPKARIGWQGLKKHEYLRTGYSYLIGGTDFSHGSINLDNIWYVSKDRYDMDTNIQVSKNDVLVTKDGTIGKVALVPEIGKPATLNSGVFVFRTSSRLLPKFLFRVLSSSVFREFIDTLSAGSTIKHLYQKDLKNFEFEIPVDMNEQEAIANTLTAMDEEIEALEFERDKIIQIREGAMDDLLTGRVRLKA